MKKLRNLKIRHKTLLVFGVLVSLLVFLSIFSGAQLFNADRKYTELINSPIGRRDSAHNLVSDMDRLSINLTNEYLSAGEISQEEITGLRENFTKYSDSFKLHLDEYRENLYSDNHMNITEKQENITLLNEAEYLFINEYCPIVEALNTDLNGEAQDLRHEIMYAKQIGDKISERLDTLYDSAVILAERVSSETTNSERETIFLQSAISTLIILIALAASVYMTRSICIPLLMISSAMTEISNGHLDQPLISGRNDEFGILANQIGKIVSDKVEKNNVMAIMENLDTMVIVIDFEYNIKYINNTLTGMSGQDGKNFLGEKCYNAIKGADNPCSICLLPQLIPDKDSYPTVDYKFLYDSLTDMYLTGTASIIKWGDGSQAFLNIVKNDTALKESQDQLIDAVQVAETANDAKSRFLASVSHEIRTPMNAIIGMSDLLFFEHLNNRQQQLVIDMKTSAMALLNIINDILDVSKIQSGKMTLTPVHYDFDLFIDSIGSIAQALVKSKSISFKLVVQEHPGLCLYGDDLRLRQVLLNLLSNAIKFTNKGYVQLNIDFTVSTMNFTVTDTGIGMQKETLASLFRPFEQFDQVNNRSAVGTGLGLAIVKSIVELMGGQISVESVYGEGSSFRVELPMILGDETKIHHDEENSSVVFAPDAAILVVDDNAANLNVAAGLLRVCKIKADTATSGELAIKMLNKRAYDIVFMDYRMPGMSGTETASAIRDMGLTMPIIALTASVLAQSKGLMLSAGMDDFLIKPIIKSDLMCVLRKWLPPEKITDAQPEMPSTAEIIDEGYIEFWAQIERIGGLDASAGLDWVDGQRNVYEKTLRLVMLEIEKSEKNLIAYLSAGDYKGFRVEIHGLKCALANAGAVRLSQRAYDLEVASGEMNSAFCISTLPGFLESLIELNMELKRAFAIITHDAPPIDLPPELPHIFMNLMEAIDVMDLVLINQEIENLNLLELNGPLKEKVDKIKEAVMLMDYDRALKQMRRLISVA